MSDDIFDPHHTAEPEDPERGSVSEWMPMLLLEYTGLKTVFAHRNSPVQSICGYVGDPGIDPMRHLFSVTFWVGGNSRHYRWLNQPATNFLHTLLTSVATGSYPVSAQERAHAQMLLTDPGATPVIHGPCVVSGVAGSDDQAPAALGEVFTSWYESLADDPQSGLIASAVR